jgi:TonB family protein
MAPEGQPATDHAVWENDFTLALDWHEREFSPRVLRAGIGSVLVHVFIGLFLFTAPVPWTSVPDRVEEARTRRSVTPLVAPHFEITQKAPNKGKVAKEVDLESLLPRPRIQTPPAAPKRLAAPLPAPPAPKPAAPIPVPEPPKIEVAQQRAPAIVQNGIPQAPPPQIQPEEKPKLAFETPGATTGAPAGARSGALGRIAPPQSSVEDATRNVARGGGQGALIVGDVAELPGPMAPGISINPYQGRAGSSLELLSDPAGVDFKPYLVKVLSAVRRNWFAVIPESAKLGRRGKVLIQFSIDRQGNVPKLVIAMPSGAEALDRAAVAGISASNPFPPLPAEFHGEQIRLQFSFLYNIAK